MPTATATPNKKRVVKKQAAAPAPPPAPISTPLSMSKDGSRGQIQVRMSQDLVDRLGIEAERRMVSKAWLVEQIIANALPKWEEQDMVPS